jgi:hypothetical protein
MVSGSPENARVRNFAKHRQTMVLAALRHLKEKVYSVAGFRESNRLNMWMDFDGVRESAAQRITSA